MIAAILLIPEEGDPLGLLREGPCGARPPMAWYCDDYQAWEQWHRGMDHAEPAAWAAMVERARCALILAWDGEPVGAGCFAADGWAGMHLRDTVARAVKANPERQQRHLDRVASHVRHYHLGTLVLLDAEGREIKDSPAKGPQQEKTP